MTTVAEFLRHGLGTVRRVDELTGLCREIADQPLDATVADLRAEIGRRQVTTEDQWRLHVLISQLYHLRPEVARDLVTALRAEVAAAYRTSRTAAPNGETMSCPNPDCRRGGCTTHPAPVPAGTGRTR
jgi:hypothetical protein